MDNNQRHSSQQQDPIATTDLPLPVLSSSPPRMSEVLTQLSVHSSSDDEDEAQLPHSDDDITGFDVSRSCDREISKQVSGLISSLFLLIFKKKRTIL
jgi:hypothetical protein